eukprot:scaffold256_cov261-Pinguiococcus_pyrenoidosus.AAC.41
MAGGGVHETYGRSFLRIINILREADSWLNMEADAALSLEEKVGSPFPAAGAPLRISPGCPFPSEARLAMKEKEEYRDRKWTAVVYGTARFPVFRFHTIACTLDNSRVRHQRERYETTPDGAVCQSKWQLVALWILPTEGLLMVLWTVLWALLSLQDVNADASPTHFEPAIVDDREMIFGIRPHLEGAELGPPFHSRRQLAYLFLGMRKKASTTDSSSFHFAGGTSTETYQEFISEADGAGVHDICVGPVYDGHVASDELDRREAETEETAQRVASSARDPVLQLFSCLVQAW